MQNQLWPLKGPMQRAKAPKAEPLRRIQPPVKPRATAPAHKRAVDDRAYSPSRSDHRAIRSISLKSVRGHSRASPSHCIRRHGLKVGSPEHKSKTEEEARICSAILRIESIGRVKASSFCLAMTMSIVWPVHRKFTREIRNFICQDSSS